MCTAPELHSPNFDAHFSIHCDATNIGVGAALMQEDTEVNEVPIPFMSKKLNKCQSNYTVTETAADEKVADNCCWKLWLPKELVPSLLREAHEEPWVLHCGIAKMLEKR